MDTELVEITALVKHYRGERNSPEPSAKTNPKANLEVALLPLFGRSKSMHTPEGRTIA